MLELERVDFRYPNARALSLRSFSMRAERGSICALVGPNGAGKSTALGLAVGWLKPLSGAVRVDGAAAFLPQSERLAFAFSCLEYATFGRAPAVPYLASPSRKDRELAMAALERVGMAGKKDHPITALSGGELQLVRLARALAQDAPWLVLDEPSEALDPAHAASLCLMLRELAEGGKGIVLSTHDLALALAVADRAILIRDGACFDEGPSGQVLSPEKLSSLFGVEFTMERVPSWYGRAKANKAVSLS